MGSLYTGDDLLVKSAVEYVRSYMSNYDASHSWDHVERVVRLARYIASESPPYPAVDARVVELAALFHDVGDRKYLKPGEDASTVIAQALRGLGAPDDLAEKVQAVCLGVSYSGEIANPDRVKELISAHPELAVVQDADRLDALGAVGIGRLFTYGGAKTGRSMAESMEHLDDKLLKLQYMAKTEIGRQMARERTEKLQTFKQWWTMETEFMNDG